ncbi:MAG TPA: alginate export family protein [Gemmatimonadaceae bacterium]
MRPFLFGAALLLPAPLLAQLSSQPAPAGVPPEQPGPPPVLRISGELRVRPEGYDGGAFNASNGDGYMLTRMLLGAGIQTSRLTMFFVQGMDAQAPGKNKLPAGPPFRDYADLRQAYFQLGPESAQWVRVGRFELAFGEGRLVGSLPWANTARTFDGGRAALVRPGYRVDVFAASVVKVDQGRFDKNIPGNNFYGVYSSFDSLLKKGVAEPYFFWRRQSGIPTGLAATGTMSFGTLGLRAAGRLPAHWDYNVEMAAQRGGLAQEKIAAWAGHWLLGYTMSGAALQPRPFAEFNAASGDENPTDDKRGTFDQLYPTGHEKYGLTDLVGWQNMKHMRTGIDLALPRRWTGTVRYSNYWLAKPRDALYSGSGAVVARSPSGSAGTYVGREVDAIASGRLVASLTTSLGVGRLLPGTFLKNTTPGATYTYTYLMLVYAF